MGLDYDAKEWRLFIDSFSRSLKAVLLHNGKMFFIYPYWAFSTNEDTHNSMNHLLSAINYQKHKWRICGGLKVVGLVLGLQGGYTKYPYFLCLWNNRVDDQHYVRQERPLRQGLKPASHSVQSHPLVEPNKILLPPLHIKLGVMRNFMKAMDREGSGFTFLQKKFLRISVEKVRVGIFDAPQIRELMKDAMFDEVLSEAKLPAWQSLKSVVTNFLGKPPECRI